MRSVLGVIFVAATVSVGICAAEASLLPGKAILYESPKVVRQVTSTTEESSALTVALVTFGPGPLYWERFGHNAIVIDDPAAGTRMAYNYGVFDFQEERFLLNFARGHMHYSLDAEPLDVDLASYVPEGRSLTV
jgi:Domain of unknown function (DUF4105)